MENCVLLISKTARNIFSDLGFYFYLLPAVWFAVLLIVLTIGALNKKFRYADKKFFSPLTSSLTVFYFAFAVNSSDLIRKDYLCFSMLIISACFISCFLLSLQSELKIRLSAKEKRLIGRLSFANGSDASGNIRRIEFFGKSEKTAENVEPNFNEITAVIDKLRREELTPYEEDELDKTEMDIEKFSRTSPSPFERKILSDRLMKIIKMTSKYNIAD